MLILPLLFLENFLLLFLLCLQLFDSSVLFCVVTILTLAEWTTSSTILVALTIFLDTMSLTALATLLNFLYLKTKTKPNLLYLLICLNILNIKAISVSGKRLDNSLLMLGFIFTMIATAMTVAVLVAEKLLLETLTV
jgi:hypothetical protein